MPEDADDNPEVFDEMSAVRMERMLAGLNLSPREVGNNVYGCEIGGVKLVASNRLDSLQLSAGFAAPGITLSRINGWNRDMRFAKAYLDAEDHPVLEADFPIAGGVTEGAVREWVGVFLACLKEFVAETLSDAGDELPPGLADGPMN